MREGEPTSLYELLFDLAPPGLLWELRDVYKADALLFRAYADPEAREHDLEDITRRGGPVG